TVFDDVFVPWERVFLLGDTRRAGQLALTFVEYHRMTAVSYKLPLLDLLVGLAGELAAANGIARASHVRDKLVHLIGYAETVRGLPVGARRTRRGLARGGEADDRPLVRRRPRTCPRAAARGPRELTSGYPPSVAFESIDELQDALLAQSYLPDRGLATALFLA